MSLKTYMTMKLIQTMNYFTIILILSLIDISFSKILPDNYFKNAGNEYDSVKNLYEVISNDLEHQYENINGNYYIDVNNNENQIKHVDEKLNQLYVNKNINELWYGNENSDENELHINTIDNDFQHINENINNFHHVNKNKNDHQDKNVNKKLYVKKIEDELRSSILNKLQLNKIKNEPQHEIKNENDLQQVNLNEKLNKLHIDTIENDPRDENENIKENYIEIGFLRASKTQNENQNGNEIELGIENDSGYENTDEEMNLDYTLPDNVCGRCPPSDTLDVCKCANMGGSYAGTINMACNDNLTSLNHLKQIIENTDFVFSNISIFEVNNNPTITGALSNVIWGDLTVQKLFMENNRLNFVDNKAFIGFKDTMTFLSLRNNEITHFYNTDLDDIPYLVNVVLNQNKLTFIPSDSWRHDNLKYLDLGDNEIESIGRNAFKGLRRLTTLNLSYNKITSLPDYSLHMDIIQQVNTLTIDLSYNNISYISQFAFCKHTKTHYNLKSNSLTTLNEEVFWPIIESTDYYVHFAVDENPIICNCYIKWLVECPRKAIVFSNFKCTNMDKYFYDLQVSDLGQCDKISTKRFRPRTIPLRYTTDTEASESHSHSTNKKKKPSKGCRMKENYDIALNPT